MSSVCPDSSRVRKSREDHVSIEHSLRPLWKISYYTGILLNWCRRTPERTIAIFSIHVIVMFLFAILTAFSCCFQFVQLILEMLKKTSSIHSIIPNLLWFSHYPVNVMVVLSFIFQKETLLSYFQDFAALERSILHNLNRSIKGSYLRLYKNVYVIYMIQGVSLVIATAFIMSQKLEGASYLMCYYPILRDTLTIPLIVALHLTAAFIGAIHFTLSNLVPAWTFYHCGLMLESLACKMESHTSTEYDKNFDIKKIKNRFQNVCRLTERANKLFGYLIVGDHLTILSMTCTLSYIMLSGIGGGGKEIFIYFLSLVAYIGHLTIPVLMTAHLRTGFDRLRNAVVGVLNAENSKEEMRGAKLFLSTMEVSQQSAARPLNLYDITPSTLLFFANLTVSYVIVLLQSK